MSMETIGEKIYKLRKKQGVSQEELGFQIGVSRQTVSKWEANTMNPNMDSIIELCDFFNVTADYFLTNAERDSIESGRSDSAVLEIATTLEMNERMIEETVNVLQPDKKKGRRLLNAIFLISIVGIISLVISLLLGFTALTDNKGDAVYTTAQLGEWEWIVSFSLTSLLFIVDMILIRLFLKKKKEM